MTLMAGQRLGRYEIRSKIGEGGMGEVYLAQDTKLDRKVALKVLPADLAANQERMRRFTQEAKAAALNHPNIAHIYEIGEHDGTSFIAMEYVDGRSARTAKRRDGHDCSSSDSNGKMCFTFRNPVIENISSARAHHPRGLIAD